MFLLFGLFSLKGVKRCHDRGNSGWWILIPYYGFWLLFADSEAGLMSTVKTPKVLVNCFSVLMKLTFSKMAKKQIKNIYYSNGENQFGPFDLKELESKQIKVDTLILV